jgi:hypothetical protein
VKRAGRIAVAAIAIVAIVAVVPPLRQRALAAIGGALLYQDAAGSGDLIVLSESGDTMEFLATELDASDFVREGRYAQIMVMRASPTPLSEELARRGVMIENPVIATLRQLGVPAGAVVALDAGEGGTTESTQSLAAWVREHPSRMLVMIGAAHSRRYRRALLRAWPAGAPPPLIHYPTRTMFRASDWWTTRRSLREGLFELQKLAWDYLTHPF